MGTQTSGAVLSNCPDGEIYEEKTPKLMKVMAAVAKNKPTASINDVRKMSEKIAGRLYGRMVQTR